MKLSIKAVSPVSVEIGRRNGDHARSLGFPKLGKAERPRLAVVGGGTSIARRIDELREFDGDVWAINGAHHYLKSHGVDCWFFTCDPMPWVVDFARGATKAMLTTDCDPSLFELLKDADVEAVDIEMYPHGATTSSCAPAIAFVRGYKEIHFYGCEGSFGKTTHAYGNYGLQMMVKVACDGEEFLSSADMVVQVEHLGEIMRAAYKQCFDHSGGLLSAYLRSPDIDVLAAAPDFYGEVMMKLPPEKPWIPAELIDNKHWVAGPPIPRAASGAIAASHDLPDFAIGADLAGYAMP